MAYNMSVNPIENKFRKGIKTRFSHFLNFSCQRAVEVTCSSLNMLCRQGRTDHEGTWAMPIGPVEWK